VYNVASFGKSLKETAEVHLSEQYFVNTFRRGKSLGQISWMSTYKESSITTSGGSQQFVVSCKSGIYADVKRVQIDFTREDGIRELYFIG
jgi:hypothetical protein